MIEIAVLVIRIVQLVNHLKLKVPPPPQPPMPPKTSTPSCVGAPCIRTPTPTLPTPLKTDPTQKPTPQTEIRAVEKSTTSLLIGVNLSQSTIPVYNTVANETLLGGSVWSSYLSAGQGNSIGAGVSAAFYMGFIYNIHSKEEYTGLTITDGITFSAGEIGFTLGLTHGPTKDSPGGFFIGYAPGAHFSIFHSASDTHLWIQ